PSTLGAVDVPGEGKTGLADLYVASIYNSPDANLATLLRNDGKEFPKLAEATLPGLALRANRLALKAGRPELLCLLVLEGQGDAFHGEGFRSGRSGFVAPACGLS